MPSTNLGVKPVGPALSAGDRLAQLNTLHLLRHGHGVGRIAGRGAHAGRCSPRPG